MAVGVSIGILANVIRLLLDYILYYFGIARVLFWQIAALQFLPQEHIQEPLAMFIGAVADMTVAASLGVVFCYFLDYFGRKYTYLKGGCFGLLTWVLVFGIFIWINRENLIVFRPSCVLAIMISHLAFGLALTFFADIFLKD